MRRALAVICFAQLACGQAGAAPAPGGVQKKTAVKTAAKSPKKHARRANYRYKTYFVPPPPAYMPSILPELQYGGATAEADLAPRQPENPYKKYIYSRQGHETPAPTQSRKGVSSFAWNKQS